MRTPVVLVCGQENADTVSEVLAQARGTVVVRHRYDGQVVLRSVTTDISTSDWPLELAGGCVTCTVRDDLLILLRRLHARGDVTRIVVQLMPWLEPEPVCWAVDNIGVRIGPGYPDGPAALDVRIDGVVTCVDAETWVDRATGADELDDGRTVAQVVVGQAEFADVLVVTEPRSTAMAILQRLAPRAYLTVGASRVESALAKLGPNSRRGRSDEPHDPLLVGQPPLDPDGEVHLLVFSARRPFHPTRLHDALDLLLEGVVRTRGRLWLASRFDDVMWVESAGGGMHFEFAGKWLASMKPGEIDNADLQRQALAAADWDDEVGDRQVSITVLTYGAQPDRITDGLRAALLTDDEMSRPDEWPTYADPFGDWHEDPCDSTPEPATDITTTNHGEDR